MLDNTRDNPTPAQSLLQKWFRGKAEENAEKAPDSKAGAAPRRPRTSRVVKTPRRLAFVVARESDGRRAPRAPLGVHCGIVRDGTPAILPGRTVNVSRSGALVFTLAEIPQGEAIKHLLRFRGDWESTSIPGRVVWRRRAGAGWILGVTYENTPKEIEHQLESFVEERQGEIRELVFLLGVTYLDREQSRRLEKLVANLGAPCEPVALREWANAVSRFRR